MFFFLDLWEDMPLKKIKYSTCIFFLQKIIKKFFLCPTSNISSFFYENKGQDFDFYICSFIHDLGQMTNAMSILKNNPKILFFINTLD